MVDSIKIVSINCQGLASYNKRKDVFDYHRSKKIQILCLQDTHFNKKNEDMIMAEWGYKGYFNSFSTNAR